MGLCGIIPKGSIVPRVTSVGLPRARAECGTTEGSLWVATVEVTGDNPGGGISPTPQV